MPFTRCCALKLAGGLLLAGSTAALVHHFASRSNPAPSPAPGGRVLSADEVSDRIRNQQSVGWAYMEDGSCVPFA